MRWRITTDNRNKFYILVIVASTVLISGLHYATSSQAASSLHGIYMDLYYIPVLVGASVFGLRGAVTTYISVVTLYFPYILFVWHVKGLFLAEDFFHALFFGLFAFFAGFLVDREKRYRKQLDKDAYLAALGRTAASVAHDLRNPLTVINGFAQRIMENKGNTDTAIETIMNAAQIMNKIVDSTLDFARPLQLNLQEVDITKIINHAMDTCQAKADRHEVILSLQLPSEQLLLTIDGFLFERALVNLIDNAIGASGRGEVVTISVNSGKTYITIGVKDHGSGMGRETLKNIFTPFYTTKSSGTGIGMAITKKIIDHHQGTIHIHSKLGHGTTINIELPFTLGG